MSEKGKIHEQVITHLLEFIGFMVFKTIVLILRITSIFFIFHEKSMKIYFMNGEPPRGI